MLSKRIALFQEAMRYFVGIIFPVLYQFESSIFIGELMCLRGPQVVPREALLTVVDIVKLDAIVMEYLGSELVVSTEVLRFLLYIWIGLLLLMVVEAEKVSLKGDTWQG